MKISLLLLVTFFSTFAAPIYSKEVNVYSYRKPHLIKPMFDVFTERTGIKVNSIFIGKGMLERMKSEDRNSPADLIFTVDIGKLTDFKKAGLMQPVESKSLMSDIPANYRDPENYWFGLTGRARVFVVSKTRVVNPP